MTTSIRRYSELRRIDTFYGRYEYLRLKANIGEPTFGFDRYLNQTLYGSNEWKRVRSQIIIRDNGCDMGLEDFPIEHVIVHHMNPLKIEDVEERNPDIFNPEFLICVSYDTHNAIHFGNMDLLAKPFVERRPGDTCPWR